MVRALIQGKQHFVELLLDNGLDINIFLHCERLEYLYDKVNLFGSLMTFFFFLLVAMLLMRGF